MITFHQIDFEKMVQPCKPYERSCMFGRGYLLGVVTRLRRQLSPQGLQHTSFLGTMCTGDAHGDVEQWTILADSKRLNSALGSGSRWRAFAKTGGCPSCEDVVLHTIGRIGHRITYAEYRGKFLKQKFDIFRHRIRNGLTRKGWVY